MPVTTSSAVARSRVERGDQRPAPAPGPRPRAQRAPRRRRRDAAAARTARAPFALRSRRPPRELTATVRALDRDLAPPLLLCSSVRRPHRGHRAPQLQASSPSAPVPRVPRSDPRAPVRSTIGSAWSQVPRASGSSAPPFEATPGSHRRFADRSAVECDVARVAPRRGETPHRRALPVVTLGAVALGVALDVLLAEQRLLAPFLGASAPARAGYGILELL